MEVGQSIIHLYTCQARLNQLQLVRYLFESSVSADIQIARKQFRAILDDLQKVIWKEISFVQILKDELPGEKISATNSTAYSTWQDKRRKSTKRNGIMRHSISSSFSSHLISILMTTLVSVHRITTPKGHF